MFLGYRPPCMCGLEYPEQARDILPKRTAAYRKTTELVHTQLVRKGRAEFFDTEILKKSDLSFLNNPNYRGELFDHPIYGKVYTTGRYNIKSPSKMPYDRNDYNNLGLNQYFVGQSPYQYYIGDPGDDNGIYHDKSQIIGPARGTVTQCDTYSAEQLLSGKGLKYPFKMYEKITQTTGFDKENLKPITKEVITGYEVEVIALIHHHDNKIVDEVDLDGHNVYKDVSTSIYALSNGSILVYSSEYGVFEKLTFYASGEIKDQPTNLKKFVEEWNKYHGLEVKEDADGWLGVAEIVLSIIGLVGFIFAPVIAPAIGFASSGIGFALGVASVMFTSMSLVAMAAGDEKMAKIFGILSAITGLAVALKNIFSFSVGSNVASSSASTLSAAGTAGKMGLSQTSSLYLGTGAMNASGVGASNLTSMSFSEVLKASNTSFSEAINVSVSGIESSVEASLWSSTMDALKSSYKVYSNTKDVFKSANDFGDDEIPNNDDKEVKRPVALRFNGSLESMVGYAKEGADDIGLMEGSALYLRPSDKGFEFLANLGLENVANDDFLASLGLNNVVNTGNSLESRVLKLVHVKQIKLYKKAKKGAYNTRISKKRSKNG
nr:hypothetical protein [uncultured Campylobacter sp.]